MSSAVSSGTQIVTNKFKLTETLFPPNEASENFLRSVFQEAMKNLEETANTSFEASMKERVWERVSEHTLKDLNKILTNIIRKQVLFDFNEKEAANILLEMQEKEGVISDEKCLFKLNQLSIYLQLSESGIIDIFQEKTSSLIKRWVRELITALTNEGIFFPKPEAIKAAASSQSTTPPDSATESALSISPKKSPFQEFISAIEAGNLNKVKEALQRGEDPNAAIKGQNVIHLACDKGYFNITCELLNYGAELNGKSSGSGDTPLHRACIFGHANLVKELLQRGACIDMKNKNSSRTPLEVAIKSNQFGCCKLLVTMGVNVNEINNNTTPLLEACRKGNYKLAELLLNHRADPNLKVFLTPLYESVHVPAILRLLLTKGANPNAQNSGGLHYQALQYPLHAATLERCYESVEILLNAGADPELQDGQGQTPLALAEAQLHYHQTTPSNPPEVTNLILARLTNIIRILTPK